jgi:hypothetical protein
VQPDTIITLGDFEFSRLEIPERIPFGGEQRLAVHELVGGVRVIDAMGRADAPLEWSGMFLGDTALERARYLDGLRIAGNPLTLTWDELAYEVVIASFKAEFERFYQIPYQISCTVLQDLNSPVTTIADPGIDDLVGDDMNTASGLGGLIGDGPLSSALTTLNSAIGAVSSFAGAAQSVINTVLEPLAAVQARVQILIASTGNTISNVATLGGILPNQPIAQSAASLTNQMSSMTQLPNLYSLQSVLGRMGGNLGAVGMSSNTITSAGGNLFGMAAQAYKDATAWTTLARANKLTDPQLTGVNTIMVPASHDNSGGVLSG